MIGEGAAELAKARHGALMLATTMRERRQRYRFSPGMWLGDGFMHTASALLLGVLLILSTVAAFAGIVMLATCIFLPLTGGIKALPGFLKWGAIFVGLPLIANVVIIWMVGKVVGGTPRQQEGIPFWLEDVFKPGTRFREAAVDLLRAPLTPLDIALVLSMESAERMRRSALLGGVILTGTHLMLTFYVVNYVAPPGSRGIELMLALVALGMTATSVGMLITCADRIDPAAFISEKSMLWASANRGERLYATSASFAGLVMTYMILLLLGSWVVITIANFGGWLAYPGFVIATLFSLSVARHLTSVPDPASLPSLRSLNAGEQQRLELAFQRFAAQELLEDEDRLRTMPPPQMPKRTSWSGGGELFVDVLRLLNGLIFRKQR